MNEKGRQGHDSLAPHINTEANVSVSLDLTHARQLTGQITHARQLTGQIMSQNKLLDNTAPDLRGPQWTLSSRRPDAWCFAWVNFRLHKVNQFRVYVALTALAGQSTQCCPAPGAVEAIAVLPSSAVQKALGELNELGVVVSRPGVEPARPVLHTIVIVEPSEDGGAA